MKLRDKLNAAVMVAIPTILLAAGAANAEPEIDIVKPVWFCTADQIANKWELGMTWEEFKVDPDVDFELRASAENIVDSVAAIMALLFLETDDKLDAGKALLANADPDIDPEKISLVMTTIDECWETMQLDPTQLQ
ncbi:hypothetical protein [Ruegeria lacuscaerulensis]|uniref:hypothetical protein n=1 Tax=Ruegeria lacuscaerulensis TaxID=55218 RepID=UPI00147DF85B|nr:hypothetical protein [Ruegeria lacuscaerulensis]